jgi:hypothetical protein
MLRLYAVDPEVAALSNPSFLSLSNSFGFDRGRVIARFPGNWVKQAIKAVRDAEEIGDIEKTRMIEAIKQAKHDKMVKSGRNFDPTLPNWLSSCLAEHIKNPFDAIIVRDDNVDEAKVISAKEATDENHPLLAVEGGAVIEKTATEIAGALAPYFKSNCELWFHDKYFRLHNLKYRETLGACLAQIPLERSEEIRCQIHSCETERAPHQREFPTDIVGKLIPEGITIEWFHWDEKPGGVKFHDRYLLTEAGGVLLGDGFSAEGPGRTVNLQLIAKPIYESARETIVPEASAYELKDKFRILSDGSIEEF